MNIVRRLFESPERSSRILIGGLFLALAWRLGSDFVETQRPTDLLTVVGAALVVILTCLRRSTQAVDRRTVVRTVTGVSMLAPLLIDPGRAEALISESAAVFLLSVGLIIALGGKMSLGRSFGVLPANRGVREHGLYRVVRHPIYLGYLITHIGFLAAHPSAWNAAVLLVGDVALLVRALYEEQTLVRDPQYVRYCQNVRWRIIPGVC